MSLTRRHLFRSTAAVVGAAAVTGITGLADEAVAGGWGTGRTTLDRVLVKGRADHRGWRPVVAGPGEPHRVRTDLAAGTAGRKARRTPVLAFVQLSDVHIVDAQSPLRLESGESISSSAYRPHEVLTAHIAEAMVRELNQIGAGPVTGEPLALALQTGDNSDNGQYNEVRWNIDLLDGGEIRQDSGDPSRYEGVMDGEPAYYDVNFWHPHGTPAGQERDIYRSAGFPRVPGLLDACRRPFRARGLNMEWFSAFGNHDELWQGNFPHTPDAEARAVGDTKLTSKGARTVTPDPDRRLLSRAEMIEEHFTTTGLPVGHGFTDQNRQDGTAYYTVDRGDGGLVRFIVLDSVNQAGGQNGAIDPVQFAWLHDQLEAAADHLVGVASHHPSWSMNNDSTPTGSPLPLLGAAVVAELLAHENVIAWVNGHTHRNAVKAHERANGGGFWEINTASHIDWPQQSRIVEVTDNHDGTLSLFTTMVDHGAPSRIPATLDGPVKLAALGRTLAANDVQETGTHRQGRRPDRNVELLLPAPAFLSS